MVNRGDFHYVHFADKPGLALAQAQYDPDLAKRLHSEGKVSEWETLGFVLDGGIVVDYLANTFAFRLCSQRLRDVIDSHRGDRDTVQWLHAVAVDRGGAELSYWVLHFPEVPDVLNKTKSVFSGSVMIKACLDAEQVAGHRVFTLSHYGVYLVVADQVRDAIRQAPMHRARVFKDSNGVTTSTLGILVDSFVDSFAGRLGESSGDA
jgi:hypothetical protein